MSYGKEDDNIIKHASRQIKTETQILKRELDKELSAKVHKRLKSNDQKLNNIRTALKDIETDNQYLYTDGNSRLSELEQALAELEDIINQMTRVRDRGESVTTQCEKIQRKIEETSTKISSSMTSLNDLLNNKHKDTKVIGKDLKKLRKEMTTQHASDHAELVALWQKLDAEIVTMDKNLQKDLSRTVNAAKTRSPCCTIL